jgi:mRNA interferase MazF
MEKDFDSWNSLKKTLDSDNNHRGFEQSEIWWCSLGINVGDEQDGKNSEFTRPILILKKFNDRIFLGVPLTTSIKKNNPFYYSITFNGKGGSVILSQIKLLSAKRLRNSKRAGKLSAKIFDDLRERIRKMI